MIEPGQRFDPRAFPNNPLDPPPARPINRETMLERLAATPLDKPNPLAGLKDVTGEHFRASIETAEWFDFGSLVGENLQRIAEDAKPFRTERLIRAPFPICCFRLRAVARRVPSSDIVLLIHDVQRTPKHVLDIAISSDVSLASATMLTTIRYSYNFSYLESIALHVLDTEQFVTLLGDKNIANGACKAYEALWLILNTRRIRKTVETPSEKLNKSRIKVGKQPLRRVTRIDAAQYVRALQETERMETSGSHASPRMHLRRAHLRRYNAARFGEHVRGTTKFIEAMIINGDKEEVVRERYEVRT